MFLTKASDLIIDALLALVYPQECANCHHSVEDRRLGTVCLECWRGAHTFTAAVTICWKCGAPSVGSITPEKREAVRCRRCDNDFFTAARACGIYDGALKAAVLGLKREPNISQQLLQMLVEVQRRSPIDQSTLIVPVPLHPDREEVRGFNQAAIIGKALARRVNLPFDEKNLIRTTHSEKHRSGMDSTSRRSSVANAFAVTYPSLVAGEKVLLIDDVFTTGATVSACAEALIGAGSEAVFVLTIARPLRN